MLRVTILLLAMSLAPAIAQAVQVAPPDPLQGDGRVSGFYTWEGTVPPTPGQMLRQETLEPTLGLADTAAAFRILYSSTNGIDGTTPVVVSGLIFLPRGKPPEGGWPLLAWAHETAGMADICAPSWTGYSMQVVAFLNTWLRHGFAVVATDYQGLGTPGPHPYVAVRPAAYSVLDSIRAAQHAFPEVGKKVLLAGWSQGAGAVFGADALQPSYAPDLDVRGAIATGLPYFTPETIVNPRKGMPVPFFDHTLVYPLLIGLMAQQADPALKGSDMFRDEALPLFELTRRACIWQLVLEVLDSRLTRAEAVKPGYTHALMANLALLEYPSLKLPQPIFLGIGEADYDTPARLQLALVKKTCDAGSTVEAHLYTGTTHQAAVTRSLPGALQFADKALTGKGIPSVCTPEPE